MNNQNDNSAGVVPAPRPSDEEDRIKALYALDILDSLPEQEFDGLTRLASRICEAPVSRINLLDSSRQWTKSAYGTKIDHSPREKSVCQYTILQDELLEVSDLRKDERFSNASYVKGAPRYRFYAGAPLVTSNGHAIGALCVLDTQTRSLTPDQRKDLKVLADEVVARLELRRKQKELEALNKQKNELMSVVSHDMRNPLMGIIGASDFLLEESEESREERRELVGIIKDSAERLLQIVTELLDSELVHFRNLRASPVECDPAQSIRQVLQLYEFSAANKKIDLALNLESNIPRLKLDDQKFTRIIANLVSNSVKFTPRGGRIEVDLEFHGSDNGKGTLEATVSDTGIGISDEDLDRLFEKHNGDGRSGTDNEHSYGLGMHIVKQLTDICGASLKVHSTVGEGTRFEIQFPAEKVG
ncbi:MAG: GAF domain-containing sensor histidine kinase [Balneolaceae bacterium]|nr:GAF domain-containing sensor histidine kinase [Balneolaceae bacterium]